MSTLDTQQDFSWNVGSYLHSKMRTKRHFGEKKKKTLSIFSLICKSENWCRGATQQINNLLQSCLWSIDMRKNRKGATLFAVNLMLFVYHEALQKPSVESSEHLPLEFHYISETSV